MGGGGGGRGRGKTGLSEMGEEGAAEEEEVGVVVGF